MNKAASVARFDRRLSVVCLLVAALLVAPSATRSPAAAGSVEMVNGVAAPADSYTMAVAGDDSLSCLDCVQYYVYFYNLDMGPLLSETCQEENPEENCPIRVTFHSLLTSSPPCGSWGGEHQVAYRGDGVHSVRPISLADEGGGEGDASGSGCARCGGSSSTCHHEGQVGACHVPCTGEASEIMGRSMQQLNYRLRLANRQAVREILGSVGISFNRERGSIQVALPCNPELIGRNIELDPWTLAQVVAAVDAEFDE